MLLAEPRGFCAGVEKAIKALAWMVRVFEPPVYCYHEIVHNRHVVERFRAQGVIFVDDVADVPEGAPLMLSAHGSAPAVDLFAYDPQVGAALSLRANTMTPDQIAAASASAPGGNANALDVADMLKSKMMGTSTYSEFFGTLGGRVGSDVANAQSDRTTQQGLVDQARNLRSQISSVSLDQEATELLQVQRSYQASAKVMGVLNNIMDTLMQTI